MQEFQAEFELGLPNAFPMLITATQKVHTKLVEAAQQEIINKDFHYFLTFHITEIKNYLNNNKQEIDIGTLK